MPFEDEELGVTPPQAMAEAAGEGGVDSPLQKEPTSGHWILSFLPPEQQGSPFLCATVLHQP